MLAYWINAVSFLVSAVLVARIPARLLQSTIALTRGHWTDLKDGFSFVLHSRPLLAVLVALGYRGPSAAARSTSARSFSRRTRCTRGDFGYGLLYGALGAGLVAGSVGAAR